MSDHDQIPALRAIEGGACALSEPAGRLVLVGEGTLVQLPLARPGLPRLRGSKVALIYATLAAVAGVGLEICTDQLGLRQVIDLRVDPAFGALGLRHHEFVACLSEGEISYLHLPALANPYIDDSWHAEHYRRRLMGYYRERVRALTRLRQSLDEGPVLVLVAERSAIEFELLVRALERVEPGFDAHALPPM